MSSQRVFTFIVFCLITKDGVTGGDTTGRSLIFPITAPTRAQLIYGIGIPLELEYESMTTGYVLKTQHFLPTKAEHYRPLMVQPQPINKRSIRDDEGEEVVDPVSHKKFMKYQGHVIEIYSHTNSSKESETDDEFSELSNLENSYGNLDKYRWALYRGIESIADRMGLEGKSCLLRSICEAAEIPFHYENGLLGELMHILLTPSSSKESIQTHSDNDYFHAEIFGKSGNPCHTIFKSCKKSLLEKFSSIFYLQNNVFTKMY